MKPVQSCDNFLGDFCGAYAKCSPVGKFVSNDP